MLRIVFSRSQGFNNINLPASSLVIHTTQRFLSTNSAIRRGLRKSQPKTRNAEPRFQSGRNRSTTYSEGRTSLSFDRRQNLPKQRRPNHEQGLDIEDMVGPEIVDKRGTNFLDGFARLGPSSSFKRHDREAEYYRKSTRSLGLSHRSNWDKGSSSTHAPQDKSPLSRRFESRSLPASEPSRRREDAFREQLRTTGRHEYKESPSSDPSRRREGSFREQLRTRGRHEYKESPSSASTKERQQKPWDQIPAPKGLEPRRSSSFARSARKSLTRAEQRFALYGHGDTAPGGIPRSESHVEENGDILRPASKQLRMAAKRRQLGGFSEPGLADERDFISDAPSHRTRSGERGLPSRIHEEPGRLNVDVPLSIPYTTPASEFLYGTSVIFAALTAMRRKMYKLYVYNGENREVGVKQSSIEDLARDRRVEVVKVEGDGLRMMDKISTGRAHNVCQPGNLPHQFPAHWLPELM